MPLIPTFEFFNFAKCTLTEQEVIDVKSLSPWICRLNNVTKWSSSETHAKAINPTPAELDSLNRLLIRFPDRSKPVVETVRECQRWLDPIYGERLGKHQACDAENLEICLLAFQKHIRLTALDDGVAAELYFGDPAALARTGAILESWMYRSFDLLNVWRASNSQHAYQYLPDAIERWRAIPGLIPIVNDHITFYANSHMVKDDDPVRVHFKREDGRSRASDFRNWRSVESLTTTKFWPQNGRELVYSLLLEWDEIGTFFKWAAENTYGPTPTQLDELKMHTELLIFQAALPSPSPGVSWPHSMTPILGELDKEEQREYRSLVKQSVRVFANLNAVAKEYEQQSEWQSEYKCGYFGEMDETFPVDIVFNATETTDVVFEKDLEPDVIPTASEDGQVSTGTTKPAPPLEVPESEFPQLLLNAIQIAILKALDGRALTVEKLAREATGGDATRLYRAGGLITVLAKNGLVAHLTRVGYYRPDSPPGENVFTKK